jgi:signal transduction histidine kinase
MQSIIEDYNKLILTHVAMLLEAKPSLNAMQLNSIVLIDKYTQELSKSLQQSAQLSESDKRRFIRHDIFNLITPILGYAEMLSDAWLGNLDPDQSAHAEIILYAAYDILQVLEAEKMSLAS